MNTSIKLNKIMNLLNENTISEEQAENSLYNLFNKELRDVIETDDGNFLFEDDLELFDSIDCYYSGSDTVDSTDSIYKAEVNGEEVFILNRCNSNEYEEWDDLSDLVETLNKQEVFYQGSEELKDACSWGDIEDWRDIEYVVTEVQYEEGWGEEETGNYIYVMEVLEDNTGNPPYTLDYIGKNENGELIDFTLNNCNVTRADRPKGFFVTEDNE